MGQDRTRPVRDVVREYEVEEDYWLTTGWPTLRRQLAHLAWITLEPQFISDKAKELSGGWVARFENNLHRAIDARARHSSFWAEALRLFPLPDSLADMLESERAILLGEKDISPAAAFKTLFRGLLEQQRRSLLPGSIQRRKNWETIDRISREIVDISSSEKARCSIEHAAEVAAELARRYPSSRNLRLSPSAVKGYFEDFLPACSPIMTSPTLERLPAVELVDEDELDLVRRLDLASVDLDGCLQELDDLGKELIQAIYGLNTGTAIAWTSARAFREARGLSRHAFDMLHRDVLTTLSQRLTSRIGQRQ